MRKFLIGAAIAAVAITPAMAQKASVGHAQKATQTELRTQVSADVAKHFARLDANKDGIVTQAEVDALMSKREAKIEQRAKNFDPSKAFARLDANKDGKVTQAEAQAAFAARASAKGKPATDHSRALAALFQRADSNKDGALTLAEFSAVPHPHPGMQQAAMHGGKGGMLARADLNKDGKVSLAEAQQMALQHFDRFDLNHDGKLTPQEQQQARQQMKAQRKPS